MIDIDLKNTHYNESSEQMEVEFSEDKNKNFIHASIEITQLRRWLATQVPSHFTNSEIDDMLYNYPENYLEDYIRLHRHLLNETKPNIQ